MFDRFTVHAKIVLVTSRDLAMRFGHGSINTEHLLLSILSTKDSQAARILCERGLRYLEILDRIRREIPDTNSGTIPKMPLELSFRKAIELSFREAMALGHNYLGTEHILLGLAREDDGLATCILQDYGLNHDNLAQAVVRAINQEEPLFDTPAKLTLAQRMLLMSQIRNALTEEPSDEQLLQAAKIFGGGI